MFGIYRVFLACLVIAEHFGDINTVGQRAVGSFYVLSGFLMTMLMDGPYRGRPGAFALNRFLRLYPSYWFFGAVTAVLLVVGYAPSIRMLGFPPTAFDWLRQVAYLSYHKDRTLVPISWAVTNEIVMYALIAVGIARTRLTSVIWLIVSAAYSLAAWRFDSTNEYRYFLPMAASFPFALGACAWHFRHRLLPQATAMAAMTGVLLMLTALVMTSYTLKGWRDLLWIDHIVASAILTLFLYRLGPLIPAWLLRADTAIGRLSYPMYLGHFAAAMLVLPLRLPVLSGMGLTMALAALGGVICYWLIDRPIETIRGKVRAAPGKAADALA